MPLVPAMVALHDQHAETTDLTWVVTTSGVTSSYPEDYRTRLAANPAVNEVDEAQENYVRDFGPADFPDWIAVITHWRERLHAGAREVKDGQAGVVFADEKDLQYCEVLPLLRLPERRRLLAASLERGASVP